MKTGMIVLLAVGLAVLLCGCEFVQTHNKLATEKEAIKGDWSQVDADLQRRADLIPNLVETVKGYAKEETGVMTALANARAAMIGAQNPRREDRRQQSGHKRARPPHGGGGKLPQPQGQRKLQATPVLA